MSSTLSFSTMVLNWFDRHGRKDLPWQQHITPYRVWVSEIMLQQTQVATVIPYFLRFMERFPDVQVLAAAKEDDVLHLWSGLGYYSRARNLHKAANYLIENYQGVFPNSVETLCELPGVGRSTAGAIAAIAMGIRAPILDGNVKRVLARYQAVQGWPGKTAVARTLWDIAESYTPEDRTAEYTQAMMDLGAMICTRTKPACALCPLMESCVARQQGKETCFPEPKPRKILPEKSVRMLMIINDAGEVLLEKRPVTGVWGGLWSFPEVIIESDLDGQVADKVGITLDRIEKWEPFRHTFSHYHLNITPVKASVKQGASMVAESGRWQWYHFDNPSELGVAAPVKKLMEKLRQSL